MHFMTYGTKARIEYILKWLDITNNLMSKYITRRGGSSGLFNEILYKVLTPYVLSISTNQWLLGKN